MQNLFYDSFFTPFCFNAPCQYIPLLSLRSLISGLTPFGWLCSITLNPTYSIISYGNIIFELLPFLFTPTFLRKQLGRKTRIWGMGKGKDAHRSLVGNLAGKSPLGRPRNRWEDNIKTDLKSGGKAWTVTDRGVTCVNAVMNLRVA
jgi:hypothetical protein